MQPGISASATNSTYAVAHGSTGFMQAITVRATPSTGEDEHLPEFWPELSKASLGQLLQTYFNGDGTVGKASDVTAMTASVKLASDLVYALLRFGIWARISKRWKRATNSNHAGGWYYLVTISGQANLQQFADAIGFTVAHKRDRLAQQMQHAEHSNVDVVPISGAQLRRLRQAIGLTSRATGRAM